MKTHRNVRPQVLSVALMAAAGFPIVAAGFISGLELPEISAAAWQQALLIAGAVFLILALGIAGWRRHSANFERRLRTALDAFAEREIARERRWKAIKRPWTFSTAVAVSAQEQRKRTFSRRNNHHARPQSQNW